MYDNSQTCRNIYNDDEFDDRRYESFELMYACIDAYVDAKSWASKLSWKD